MLTVLKLGGGAGMSHAPAVSDIADLVRQGGRMVIVHGCSSATDQLGDALGVPARYVTSTAGVRSRYTDPEALRVFILAARCVNTDLVLALQSLGVPAVGLSGLDGALLRGPRKEMLRIVADGRQRVLRDDYTGRVERVNTGLLRLLLDAGYIPVIAPLALADSSEAINVDGDRAAAAVTGALHAGALLILSNVAGVLAEPPDEDSVIRQLRLHDTQEFELRATGGMRRKLMAAREALHGGARRVVIADGRIQHPVRAALAGKGTVIS